MMSFKQKKSHLPGKSQELTPRDLANLMGAFAKVLPVWLQWVDLRLEVHHRKMIGKMGFHRKMMGKQ
jgi:hypothetical protein